MRILSARVHGYLDFLVVAIFVLGPITFGLGGTAALISYLLAVAHVMLILMTRYPFGLVKSMPLIVHGLIELAVAIFCVLLPYVAGYSPGSPAKRFYVTMAAIIFIVWLLTDYRGTESHIAQEKS